MGCLGHGPHWDTICNVANMMFLGIPSIIHINFETVLFIATELLVKC